MLTVVTFKWRARPGYHTRFAAEHVNVMQRMVARHYDRPHRFVCVTDDPAGLSAAVEPLPLWSDHSAVPNPSSANGPSCYRRLRLFASDAGEIFGPRLVAIDLDAVITGSLVPLWDRPEPFVIWGDTAKGTPYNGSMFLLRAGTRSQVWEAFDPVRSPARGRALGYIGSDQAWIAACLGPHEPRWSAADGVYSFRNQIDGKPTGLPGNAAVVFFHGKRNPWDASVQAQHPWVREHWR